ncbi:tautomerase family protein [Paraburkholderia elongata]|uniref:Tautomerase family protein n=1 Tax=Paraburkholderia elongata TaxID=2675747 RepID=A0A972NGT9_9BURK|nr:tautomerase family protein [Paraburkholderia elongata]NPT53073.1 tautomerase family protein [Paraburkholderia elongata]
MPLVRVTMIKGKSPEYIKKMSDSIYEALVEAYQMPENDLFQIIEQLEPGDLIYDRRYGINGQRSDDFMIINIESDARRRDEKEAFLARLSDKLAASPGIARDDVFVRLSMNAGAEDWSFGSGCPASKMVVDAS